jgi:hypothetical protein
MNSKVKIVANATGAVINQSETNPEYGYVRVEQTRTIVDDNGFLRRKTVSALVQGETTVLEASGFYNGQELPGNIVVEESLEPFNKKNPERDLKVAGETGIICTLAGAPIYRRTRYSVASNVEDTLIKHDNVDELRAAYSAPKASAIQANTDFENI